jgi:hypothetical protein
MAEAVLETLVRPTPSDYFGTDYTAPRVANLLSKAIDGRHILDLSHFYDLEATLDEPDRRVYDYTPGKSLYEGYWNPQGEEPTCVPWTVANCLRVIGCEPNKRFMAHLLSMANICNGMSVGQVGEATYNSYFNRGFDVQPIKPAIRSFEPERNVATLINAFKEGGSVLMAVNNLWFKEELDERHTRSRGEHAICVSGFEVTPERYVNFQVIDPWHGQAMVSDRHLFDATIPRGACLFTPRLVSPVQAKHQPINYTGIDRSKD